MYYIYDICDPLKYEASLRHSTEICWKHIYQTNVAYLTNRFVTEGDIYNIIG